MRDGTLIALVPTMMSMAEYEGSLSYRHRGTWS